MVHNLLEYESKNTYSIIGACFLILMNLILIILSLIKYNLPIPEQYQRLIRLFFGCFIVSSMSII